MTIYTSGVVRILHWRGGATSIVHFTLSFCICVLHKYAVSHGGTHMVSSLLSFNNNKSCFFFSAYLLHSVGCIILGDILLVLLVWPTPWPRLHWNWFWSDPWMSDSSEKKHQNNLFSNWRIRIVGKLFVGNEWDR